MGASESSLPAAIREGVAVSADGTCTWDLGEVRDVLDAARALDLACVGAEPYLDMPGGRCGIPALRSSSGKRASGESWAAYVARSARETMEQFEMRCTDEALRESAAGIRIVRESGLDPADHVRAALRFRGPDGVVLPRRPDPKPHRARAPATSWTWYLVPPIGFPLTALVAMIHPFLGGAVFLASFLACAVAGVQLVIGRPDLNWPVRTLLLVWNGWIPVSIGALFLWVLTSL